MNAFYVIALRAVLLLAALFAVPAHATPVSVSTYRVTIDTCSLAGQSGYLDFLLMGLGGAAPVQASINLFSGTYGAGGILAGDAQGGIASGVTLGNGTGWNEFGQWADFGGMFSFTISFLGLPAQGDGINLGISLLDQDFNYLGAAGDVLTFALLPDAPVHVTAQAGFAAVAEAAEVPEPATLLHVCVGLAILTAMRRRTVPLSPVA